MSNMWIELGLSRADRSAPAAAGPGEQRPNHPPLGRLAADLLEIVAASVPDAPDLGTGDFRRHVAGYVARLTDETSDITAAFVDRFR